jgi:ribonuclease HII
MIDDKRLNLNEWEMITFFSIVQDLQKSSPLPIVFVDNWEVTADLFRQRYDGLLNNSLGPIVSDYNIIINKSALSALNVIPEHRADENYTIVGAASILAKTSSDAQYREYKKIYGDFGSGSPADPRTRLFVWQHRQNPPPIIRKSWNTYKTLCALTKIEDDPLRIKKIKD